MHRNRIALSLLALVLLVSCAGFEQRTPEEKKRIVVGALQNELETWFDAGKAYVILHPEKKEEWQTRVIPMFDVFNKALNVIVMSQGTMSPEAIESTMRPKLQEIVVILVSWGVKK